MHRSSLKSPYAAPRYGSAPSSLKNREDTGNDDVEDDEDEDEDEDEDDEDEDEEEEADDADDAEGRILSSCESSPSC